MFDDDRFFTICHSLLNIPITKYLARLGLGLQASACRLFLDNVQGSVSKFQNGDVNIHSSCFYLWLTLTLKTWRTPAGPRGGAPVRREH